MRVGIVSTQVPFVTGGAERHSASLAAALRERGHEAAEIGIPLKWYPGRVLVDHILAAKLFDLSVFEGAPIDLLVGLKFPAYLARHPNKVFWILHQHRQAYEMWDSGASDLLYDADGAAIRDLIRQEDRAALSGARVYANSKNVAARLHRYLQLPSTPLYHPPPTAAQLRSGPYGDYFFAPSRVGPSKRQDLILEAFAKTRTKARLVFAGPPDSRAYLDTLKDKARKLGVENRVEWLGAIDDATMVRRYAEARAVVFTPVDEDYGYITLEAMLSAKPVITVQDAGGPLEFIQDGKEGFVTPADPASIAAAMDRLADDRALAERLGQAGWEKYRAANIGWDKVVATLTGLAPGPDPKAAAASMPRSVAAVSAEAVDGPAAAAVEDETPEVPAEAASPDKQPVDLKKLARLLSPPKPKKPPFAGMAELLGAYRFSTIEAVDDPDIEELAAYFGTHWRRYMATLALVQEKPVRRALDVGVFPPFLFQALLVASMPSLRLDGIWEGPQPFAQTVRSRSGDHPDFSIALKPANVERQPMPFEDGSFDLVLAMEIFEHFALNPLYFLREAFRVLEPGGRLILTTPNVVSHRGVRKALEGLAPYSFGPFIPTGGVYGRHNREFTPREVSSLAEAAGFVTHKLLTADVYDDAIDEETARLLMARGDDFSLRGENILYVGRKERRQAAGTVLPAPPPHLYHGDPLQLAARLSLAGRDTTTGYATIRVENVSAAAWPMEGAWSASLHLEWSDQFGTLVHGGGRIPLPTTVLPGDSVDVTLALDPGPADASVGTVLVEMFQDGAGRFLGAGQANQLRLPCSEAAFRRVAYTA
jgi:glycosyltransferase involved in cell wall biosynthesis/SAM-dependent methyltransferase